MSCFAEQVDRSLVDSRLIKIRTVTKGRSRRKYGGTVWAGSCQSHASSLWHQMNSIACAELSLSCQKYALTHIELIGELRRDLAHARNSGGMVVKEVEVLLSFDIILYHGIQAAQSLEFRCHE